MSSISTQNSASTSSSSTTTTITTTSTTTTASAPPPAPAPAPPPPVSILLKSPPLSLSIPSTSSPESPESSKTSSPTAGTNSTASCSSLPTPHQNLSVKFAPLPELAPRRRKSSTPLGVAARGQLVRRRRGGGGYDDPPPPQPVYVWSEDDGKHVLEQVRSIPSTPQGEELGDPFAALGRMMKGAGRTLWRRVSNKELAPKTEEEEKNPRKRVNSTPGVGDKPPPVPVVVVGVTDSRVREEERVATLSEEGGGEGRVWEEEIGQTFMGRVSASVDVGKVQEKVEEAERVPNPPSTASTVTATVSAKS